MTDEPRFEPGADSFEWSDASPVARDRDADTFLPLPELSKEVRLSEAKLKALLEDGTIDGTWTGTRWLATPATVSEYLLLGWTEQREIGAQPFAARPRYSAAGDCLFFYFRDDESWADRVDEILTVYRSFATKRVVGFKLKHITLLKRELGTFLLQFATKEVEIYLIFTHMLQWKLKETTGADSAAELMRKYAEVIEAAGPTKARIPVLT